MPAFLFVIVALLAIVGLVSVTVRRAARRLPPLHLPPGETMPTTELQRLARATFVLSAIPALGAIAVVLHFGAAVVWDSDDVRLTMTGLIMVSLAVFTVYLVRVAGLLKRDDGALDERDRAILAAAPSAQAPAVVITMAVWMIGLTEVHRATHLVPSIYLYLIFWSLLLVSTLSLLAGVVIGYRRS